MELSIIHRVAQLVTSHKVDAAMGIKKSLPAKVKGDSVDVSSLGSEIGTVKARIDALPEEEAGREEKVQKIKAAVESNQYKLSEDMVNIIAERIAQTLI
jgi:anti-sigma28 factor (negative regulator of flagellin synthesis)